MVGRHALAQRRKRLTLELVAGQARAIDDVEVEVLGKPGGRDVVDDAPAATELHRARREAGRARQDHVEVVLVDHDAVDAAPAEIERQREADGTSPDDQYRGFDDFGHSRFRIGLSVEGNARQRLRLCAADLRGLAQRVKVLLHQVVNRRLVPAPRSSSDSLYA